MVIALAAQNLVYAAVPKAGCTSVKWMLAQIESGTDCRGDPDIQALHRTYPTRRYRDWRFDKYVGAFSFTVVRDPIRRLMSVYSNRIAGAGDLIISRRMKRRASLPANPDPDTFFQNLAQYKALSSRIHHHTKPTRVFTGMDLGRYSRVFRTDQMAQVAQMLGDTCGVAVNSVRVNNSDTTLDFDDLEPVTRDTLYPYLRHEYKTLRGYVDDLLA